VVAQGALPGLGRLAAHDEPEERRLAGAVGAEHGDALALLDLEARVVEQDPPAVPVPEPVDLEDLLAGVVGVREREGALLGHERLLDPLARQAEPLELLLGRGGAARLRAPGQPVDEVPLPRHLLVPLLPRDPLRRGALRLLRDELRVVALVARRDAELGLDDLGAEPVEELAVVRDDDHGHVAGALAQVGLEPLDRAQVEVVGRLVEEQQVGVLQQDLPQAHTHLPAARVRRHEAVVVVGAEPELGHHLVDLLVEERDVEVGGGRGQLLELVEERAHPVHVDGAARALAFTAAAARPHGLKLLLDLLRAPQHVQLVRVRGHKLLADGSRRDDVELLRQVRDAHPRRLPQHDAVVGRQRAGDELQLRGLPGAVDPHQAHSVALLALPGDVLQDLRVLEGERDVLEADSGGDGLRRGSGGGGRGLAAARAGRGLG
jgi:hypothetical protein